MSSIAMNFFSRCSSVVRTVMNRNLSITSSVAQKPGVDHDHEPYQDLSTKKRYSSFNQVQLIGGCVAKPFIRTSSQGSEFAMFYVITNYNKKRRDGTWYAESMKHNVILFGNLCNLVASKLDKGTRVYLMGRLKPYRFRMDDGQTFPSSIIAAEKLQIISQSQNSYDHADHAEEDDYSYLVDKSDDDLDGIVEESISARKEKTEVKKTA